MPENTPFNRSIICVDDEKGVLEAYRDVLSPDPREDLFAEILGDQKQKVEGDYFFSDGVMNYNIFLAASGEEAVRIVEDDVVSSSRHVGHSEAHLPLGCQYGPG